MKTRWILSGWNLSLALWLIAGALDAQNYVIDWSTVDAGGGLCTGGTFALAGTIGQPDGGRLSAAVFALEGGFWSSLSTSQSPGIPSLTITVTATDSLVLSWSDALSGFELQETASLETMNWSNLPGQPVALNGQNQVTIAPAAAKKFYRLHKP